MIRTNDKPGARANEQTGPDTTEYFNPNYTRPIAARIKAQTAQYHHNGVPCYCRVTCTCTTCAYWARLIQFVERWHGQTAGAS